MKYTELPLSLLKYGNSLRVIPFVYDSAEAGHVETVRLSYTVPNDRRALVVSASLSMFNIIAGGGTIIYRTHLHYSPAGGQAVELFEQVGRITSNFEPMIVTPLILLPMFPKDNLSLSTEDSSVAGSVHYSASVIVLEFDQ